MRQERQHDAKPSIFESVLVLKLLLAEGALAAFCSSKLCDIIIHRADRTESTLVKQHADGQP
jgi:hypothetical protein